MSLKRRKFAITNSLQRSGRRRQRKEGLTSAVFSVPKIGESETENADAYHIDLDHNRFVIADGVSNSYAPEKWSRLVVAHIDIQQLDTEAEAFANSLSSLLDLPDPESVPWNVAELMEKGSHTTVLVAEVSRARGGFQLGLRSIGDCVVVVEYISRGGEKETLSWPFADARQFPNAPSTLGSASPFLLGEVASLDIDGKRLLRLQMATDAIGRWLLGGAGLEANNTVLSQFAGPDDRDSFVQWVNERRSDGSLEDDDSTLVSVVWSS